MLWAFPTRRAWPAIWGWLALWLALACGGAFGQPAGGARDSAVKAAFLYKFAGFVEWPAGTFKRLDEPLVIAVHNEEAVLADLQQIVAGRTVEGRPVLARRFRDGDGLPHVLLIGPDREARVRDVAAGVPGPVLVVTGQDEGLRLGGVLNFVNDGGRVRFSASLASAESRGLRLSARLLAVAQAVEGGRPR